MMRFSSRSNGNISRSTVCPSSCNQRQKALSALMVGNAGDRLHAALTNRDVELLQAGFRQRWIARIVRALPRLERRLIPLDGARPDVVQIATLVEKLPKQDRREQDVHAGCNALRR